MVAARDRYRRAKRGHRQGDEGSRPEVSGDESYVKKNQSHDFIWSGDEDGPWVHKPTGTGERLMMMPAMTKTGWILKAKVVCNRTRKTGDDQGQMNHELLRTWFREQWLPQIPKHSLMMMDHAPDHKALSPPSAPTASCKQDDNPCVVHQASHARSRGLSQGGMSGNSR